MLDKVLQLKNNKNSVSEFLDAVRQGIPSAAFGVTDAFKNFLVSVIPDKVLLVVKDNITAHFMAEGISELGGKKTVVVPPRDELLLNSKAFSKDSAYARIRALSEIDVADVVIATAETLMQSCPKHIEFLEFIKDTDCNQEKAVEKLVYMGYGRVDATISSGTFALRGDILDIYPINSENPVRIDFFGDTIESIKDFDEETRQSLGFKDTVKVLQATEWTFDSEEIDCFKHAVSEDLKNANRERKIRLRVLADDMEVAIENANSDGMIPLSVLSENNGSIFDYLPSNTVVVIDEAKRVYDLALLNETEFNERFKALFEAGEVFSFAKNNFSGVESLTEKIKKFRTVALQALSTAIPFFNPLKIINLECSGIADYQLDFKEIFTDINNWLKSGYCVVVCTANQKRAESFNFD
ncbi:MAG: hypothetical protein IJX16_01710 [Clostridia bacterium]|nr:hypothetical protein [Clostridia bacterium]